MELKEIQELIRFVSKSGVSEVEIESKGFKINIKTPPYKKGASNAVEPAVVQVPVPVQVPTPPAPAVAVAVQEESSVKSSETTTPAPEKTSETTKDNGVYTTFKSPMIGTFYRSPTPEKPSFVNVGDDIKEGDVICIIEAMKLFNEIEADINGKIIKVLADDASPVEYEQPLFVIEPHK